MEFNFNSKDIRTFGEFAAINSYHLQTLAIEERLRPLKNEINGLLGCPENDRPTNWGEEVLDKCLELIAIDHSEISRMVYSGEADGRFLSLGPAFRNNKESPSENPLEVNDDELPRFTKSWQDGMLITLAFERADAILGGSELSSVAPFTYVGEPKSRDEWRAFLLHAAGVAATHVSLALTFPYKGRYADHIRYDGPSYGVKITMDDNSEFDRVQTLVHSFSKMSIRKRVRSIYNLIDEPDHPLSDYISGMMTAHHMGNMFQEETVREGITRSGILKGRGYTVF